MIRGDFRIISLFAFLFLLLASPLQAQLQPGNGPAKASPASTFTLRPGDALRIRVWPDTLLGGSFLVEEPGVVHLPVVGEVVVSGRTLADLRRDLRARYATAMKEPAISITPLFRVSVLGEVVRPGMYEVDPSQTLFDAISLAGGFSPQARQDKIQIIRDGQTNTLDARQTMASADSLSMLWLRSGDRIVVPRRRSISSTAIFYGIQSALLLVTLINQLSN